MKCIIPLAGKVLIKRIEAQNVSPGGIVIPDGAKQKPQKGKVISVGESKLLDNGMIRAIQVAKNDIVFFVDYAGVSIEVNGEDYLVIDEQELIAVEKE